MDRAEFISTGYCLVCEHSQGSTSIYPLRRGGLAPALSDEEVLTREIGGEYFKLSTAKDLFAYFHPHYAHCFPQLTERRRVVRHAANLWQVKAAIPQRLTQGSGQAAEPVQLLDPLPLPSGGYTRSGRDHCFPTVADSGPGAAKHLDSYGFKRGLRSPRCGMSTPYPLLPARPHDSRLVADLVEGLAGLVPADKGGSAAYRHGRLADRRGGGGGTPPRKGLTPPHSPTLRTLCAPLRKGVETVGSPRTERFAGARLRVHALWHSQHRLIRKVLAHTVGVFVNLQLGRPPLDLDGLVSA